eukprot:m.475310 g.475310  ORF g.475310 m.475310 type:complete len:174 (-) comp57141_c1_seq1:464-985(-)
MFFDNLRPCRRMADLDQVAWELQEAVLWKKLSTCKNLIALHSPAIITYTESAQTALQGAAREDRREFLALFLTFANQIDLNVRSHEGKTVLLGALMELQFRYYEMLAAAGADLFPESADIGEKLMCAVAAGDMQQVEQLLTEQSSRAFPASVCLIISFRCCPACRGCLIRHSV